MPDRDVLPGHSKRAHRVLKLVQERGTDSLQQVEQVLRKLFSEVKLPAWILKLLSDCDRGQLSWLQAAARPGPTDSPEVHELCVRAIDCLPPNSMGDGMAVRAALSETLTRFLLDRPQQLRSVFGDLASDVMRPDGAVWNVAQSAAKAAANSLGPRLPEVRAGARPPQDVLIQINLLGGGL